MRAIRGLFQAALLCALVACGGGGGGGGSGGSSGTSISVDRAAIAMEILPDSSPDDFQTMTVTFRGAGVVVGTPPGADPLPPGLSVLPLTPVGNTVMVRISYYPSVAHRVGRHVYTLRFVTGNADGSGVIYRDVPLTLTFLPQVTPAPISMYAVVGGPAVSEDIAFRWGDLPWSIRTSAPWITVDRDSGPAGADATVRVRLDPAGMAPGNYTGTVYVEETVSRVARAVPVHLSVEPRRFLLRQRGVALSHVGNQSRLTASVPILDNGDLQLAWSASSDQPWLRLATTAGTTGESLSMSADTTGLAEGLHLANVTVAPRNEPTLSGSTSIRVGLYVNRGATYQGAMAVPLQSTSPRFDSGLVADPVRPYVYRTDGNGRIDIYNVHTGGFVDTITVAGSGGLGSMAISFDGSRLFVADSINLNIVPVNLDSRSVGTPFAGIYAWRLDYTEINGRAVLLNGGLQVIDAQTGVVLANTPNSDIGLQPEMLQFVAVQRDGRAVFLQAQPSGHLLARVALTYHNGQVTLRRTHLLREEGRSGGLALDATDQTLYSLTPEDFQFPNAMQPTGFAYGARQLQRVRTLPDCCNRRGMGVVVTTRGQVAIGYGQGYPTPSVSVFGLEGAPLGTIALNSGVLGGFSQFAVSGDARRLVVIRGLTLELADLP